jgi:Uma2 family endonuclease
MTAMTVDDTTQLPYGWTYEQAKHLDLPYDWELIDGVIVPRGMTKFWHDEVRDGLLIALNGARVKPHRTGVERCVLLAEDTVLKPDVVVFDPTDLDVFEVECTPVAAVSLCVEVVSHGSRAQDRLTKPGLYAQAGVPAFWRVERGSDDRPVVHEFRRDEKSGVYAPVAAHEGYLQTDFPFPVSIDLTALLQL